MKLASEQIDGLQAELTGKERSLEALKDSAAKLQPAQAALKSCRQQAASQAAQLKSLAQLEDRLAGEQQAVAASRDRLQAYENNSADLKRQLVEKQAAIDSGRRLQGQLEAAERDSHGSAAAAKAAAAAQAAAEQQLKQCHAAQAALEKYAKAAEREAERLEAAAGGATAAHVTAEQQLQECRAAQAPLQQKALEQERLLDAISGRGENCLSSLQAAQADARKWQLRCFASATVSVCLASIVFSGFRRYWRKQLHGWTAERAGLQAALKFAQTGVQQRIRNRM